MSLESDGVLIQALSALCDHGLVVNENQMVGDVALPFIYTSLKTLKRKYYNLGYASL